MRDKVLAAVVAAATFGLVNGAILGVGLATAEPQGTIFASAKARTAPVTAAATAAPAAVFAR